MSTTTANYFRSAGWLKFYGHVTEPILAEASRLTAAVEHPDVPARSVGKYRRLTAEMLTAAAQYHMWAQRNADGHANFAMVGKAADAMSAHMAARNAWAAYVAGTLGWSPERAREILGSLTAEHANRCRRMLRDRA